MRKRRKQDDYEICVRKWLRDRKDVSKVEVGWFVTGTTGHWAMVGMIYSDAVATPLMALIMHTDKSICVRLERRVMEDTGLEQS